MNIDLHTQTAIDLVSALTLIGLQVNLTDKLKYISLYHPFRYTEFIQIGDIF